MISPTSSAAEPKNNAPALPKGGPDLWLAILLAIAAALRLAYPLDFEYKYDQIYLFQKSQSIGVTESWPALGMPSGVGTSNPPLSIWIFPALVKLTNATTPDQLTRAQIALNILALAALAALILRSIPRPRREPWLWAFAIACVNWHQVFYDRVLWSQSALPIFCVAFLASFLHRRTRWGSLALGFTGPLLGQIHMPGFYAVLGLTLALLLLDRRSVQWRAWFAGSVLGTVPMIPWIGYLLSSAAPRGGIHLTALLDVSFWLNVFDEATGTDFTYRFGTKMDDFLLGPAIGGSATRLMLTLQALCQLIGISAVGSALFRVLKNWKERGARPALLPSEWIDEAVLLWGGVVGFGVLLTLSGFRIHPHYLLAAFPLIPLSLVLGLWNREHLRRSRIVLLALVVAQALTTGFLRQYIHETGGSAESDHGVVFSRQSR